MQLLRTPVVAKAPCASRAKVNGVLSLPVRPVAPCRFKESDDRDGLDGQRVKVQEGLKEGADKLKDRIQDAASNGRAQSEPMNAQYKVNPAVPAFTRRREIFAGRIAMVGYFAAVFNEWFFPSHPNILEQVSGWGAAFGVSIPPPVVLTAILGLIGYNAVAALGPGSPTNTQANQEDVQKRTEGEYNFNKANGVSAGLGFTKANELFNGRMAMLGLAAALLQQMRIGGFSGPGILAQCAYFLNIPADASFYSLMGPSFVAFCIIIITAAFASGNIGPKQGEEEIY